MYYKILQTAASFIIKAIRIDSNKDGKVSGAETMAFIMQTIVPMMTNVDGLRGDFNAFLDRVKGLTIEELRNDLVVIAKMQLLPDEMAKVEENLDLIVNGLYKIMSGVDDIRNGLKGFGIGKDQADSNLLELRSSGAKKVTVVKK